MSSPVPIIDLFAGPGGLGEGFSSLVDEKGNRYFRIALSIEKDPYAHQTLTLRSFLRQFKHQQFPQEYYEFVKGDIELEELYAKYPQQADAAKHEAWQATLGVTPHAEIDKRIKTALKGENDFVLIGGPPCQAYSLVGRARRQEGQGLNKEDHRVYLYREYYRILAVHNPPVFVMENVKGILSSKVDNQQIFKQVIADLENPLDAYRKLHGTDKVEYNCPGYKIFSLVKRPGKTLLDEDNFDPRDFIIRAEEYGIPQARHRVILLGIRKDIDVTPDILTPADEQIGITNVLMGLPTLRSGLSKTEDNKQEWKNAVRSILDSGIDNEIDTDIWKQIKIAVNKLTAPVNDRGSIYLEQTASAKYKPEWFLDKKLSGILNHETRSHIIPDLHRYLFAAAFAKVKKRSPKLADFPEALLPKHGNIKSGVEDAKFADRFRVQLADEPSKTITSHISKDGHYYIHPDLKQCRSLTVREAARIQTFPDNYFFCGPRTQQYHQVGNAVPPYLAYQIARVVNGIIRQIAIY